MVNVIYFIFARTSCIFNYVDEIGRLSRMVFILTSINLYVYKVLIK